MPQPQTPHIGGRVRYEIRPFRPEDHEAGWRLHQRSFGEQTTRAWWDWRFRGVENGELTMAGAFDAAGRCYAMYGGVRLPLLFKGERAHLVNNGDAAVDPELRKGLGGPRLLRDVSRVHYRSAMGGSTRFTIGFPKPALRRVIPRLRQGQHLMDVVLFADDCERRIDPADGMQVRRVETWSDDVDELWARASERFDTAVVRDQSYLDWRYERHPLVEYSLLEVRDAASGTLRGLATLRAGPWSTDVASIVEWLFLPDEDEAERALLLEARRWAHERGLSKVVTWFPLMSPRARRFQVRHGYYAVATDNVEMFKSYVRGVDREWLCDHFYQTAGDIDFC